MGDKGDKESAKNLAKKGKKTRSLGYIARNHEL